MPVFLGMILIGTVASSVAEKWMLVIRSSFLLAAAISLSPLPSWVWVGKCGLKCVVREAVDNIVQDPSLMRHTLLLLVFDTLCYCRIEMSSIQFNGYGVDLILHLHVFLCANIFQLYIQCNYSMLCWVDLSNNSQTVRMYMRNFDE
jgi:hypothetical protein